VATTRRIEGAVPRRTVPSPARPVRGAVRCMDDAIEQIRGLDGRVVVAQRFADEGEHQVRYTASSAQVERDPRWIVGTMVGVPGGSELAA
jgi:hypothetical protein